MHGDLKVWVIKSMTSKGNSFDTKNTHAIMYKLAY